MSKRAHEEGHSSAEEGHSSASASSPTPSSKMLKYDDHWYRWFWEEAGVQALKHKEEIKGYARRVKFTLKNKDDTMDLT